MTRNCPGCGQEIHVDPKGKTECGGLDEGICAATQYAFDVEITPISATGTWHELEGIQAPPTPEVCEHIRAAHTAASQGLEIPEPTIEDLLNLLPLLTRELSFRPEILKLEQESVCGAYIMGILAAGNALMVLLKEPDDLEAVGEAIVNAVNVIYFG